MRKTIISFVLAFLCAAGAEAATLAKSEPVVKFNLYGMDMQVRFNPAKRVKVKNATPEEVAKCMEWIATVADVTQEDCLRLKQEYQLCDWAYLKMLDKLSQTALGNTNEAVVLLTCLFTGSGYDGKFMRNETDKQLRLLYRTDAFVSQKNYFDIANKRYFLYGDSVKSNTVCKVSSVDFKGTKVVDFRQHQTFKDEQLSEPRTLKSLKNPDFAFTVQVNKNLIDFYNEMPTFTYDDNFMTRWSIIANRPLEQRLQDTLVRQMKQRLAGRSQLEQVRELLWWMQGTLDSPENKDAKDCFLFRYDEEVWGYDRAFYAEETLFYPYCDTEDRSILLSRLIRDVVGLDVVLIYYPGHTAIAVCITDADVPGSYAVFQGRHFVICDPTYIGSDPGEEMPSMTGKQCTLILLDR